MLVIFKRLPPLYNKKNKYKENEVEIRPNIDLTFEELRASATNAINVSLIRSLRGITLGEITPALKFWLVKILSQNGYANIRALPDRDIRGGIFLKLTHGKGIATFYPTIGNGFIQLEVVSSTGRPLGSIAEEIKRAEFRPREKTERLIGRLRVYKEVNRHEA